MRLLRKDLQPVTLIKSSGQKYENISVNLQSECGKVLTTNFEIPFEEGDIFQRVLKNGISERYQIIQVNQSQNLINIDIKKIINRDTEKAREIEKKDENIMANKVFIVHGHDDAAKQEMARTLEKSGFEAIILHEQASVGMTIIEKIESYTDVDYAVVLYTECDLGRDKTKKADDEKFRTRQNVVFEHGYLMAKLGRNHVTALVKGNVETPGDITGVVYTNMDSAGAWKFELAKNMQAVGINVDLNKFLK